MRASERSRSRGLGRSLPTPVFALLPLVLASGCLTAVDEYGGDAGPNFEGTFDPPTVVLPPGGSGRSIVSFPADAPRAFEIQVTGGVPTAEPPQAVLGPCVVSGTRWRCELIVSTSLGTHVGTSWVAHLFARTPRQGTSSAELDIVMGNDPNLRVEWEAFFKDATPAEEAGLGSVVHLSGDATVALASGSPQSPPSARAEAFRKRDGGWFHEASFPTWRYGGAVLSRDGSWLTVNGKADAGGFVRVLASTATGWQEESRIQNVDTTFALSDNGTWMAALPAFNRPTRRLWTRDAGAWVDATFAPWEGAVALSGDGSTLASFVGDGDAGHILVYRRSGSAWTLDATLTPPSLTAGAFLLSSDGSTLVSANILDPPWPNSGAAHVFQRTGGTWRLQGSLRPDPEFMWQQLGYDGQLSADGNRLALGASAESLSSPDGSVIDAHGAVYIFTRSGESWVRSLRVAAPAGIQSHYFGQSVSCSADGRTVLVGEPGGSMGAPGINGDMLQPALPNSGSVYLFRIIEVGGP